MIQDVVFVQWCIVYAGKAKHLAKGETEIESITDRDGKHIPMIFPNRHEATVAFQKHDFSPNLNTIERWEIMFVFQRRVG